MVVQPARDPVVAVQSYKGVSMRNGGKMSYFIFSLRKTLVAIILFASCAGTFAENVPDGWFAFNEGYDKALKAEKPMVVDVYAVWCGPCKQMDRVTFSNKDVLSMLEKKFVRVKLNAEDTTTKINFSGKIFSAPEFSSVMEVTGFPTILFFDKKGTPVVSIPGYVGPEIFIKILHYVEEERYRSGVSLEKYLASAK